LDNVYITAITLLVGGLVLLVVDRLPKLKQGLGNIQNLKIRQLLSIGLFQSLSIVPGVSRSAASIVGGLFSGLKRVEAVEFSFLLAIPTMAAASGYDLLKTGFSFTKQEFIFLVLGSLFSFLASIIAVKSFTSFVAKHDFTVFAIYRIIFAIIILLSLKP
jgi:undecaprenyl-diphosphatase